MRLIASSAVTVVVLALSATTIAQNDRWNNPGIPRGKEPPSSGTPPRRSLAGTWDAGFAGVSPPGHVGPGFTPLGQKMADSYHPGDGPRMKTLAGIDDPLSTRGDPAGFPRNLLFELRPVHIVQTPAQVFMLYMFEQRWRVIWTDGRQLPTNPDPRWYGYSVGRWEDDYTFVVQSVGMDERTWLDNGGNPHSADLRVEERYRRVAANTIELTVTIDDPKIFVKPWTPRNRLALRLMPPGTDLMEMIPSATEAAEYRESIVAPAERKQP
jgi:hypothetical protein